METIKKRTLGFADRAVGNIPSQLILLVNNGYTFIRLGTPNGRVQVLRQGHERRLRTLNFPIFYISHLRRVRPTISTLLR